MVEFFKNSFDDFNVGVFRQLTVRQMGWLCFMDFYEDFYGRGRGLVLIISTWKLVV